MLEALADFVGGNGGSNCGKNRICSTPRATSRRNEISLFLFDSLSNIDFKNSAQSWSMGSGRRSRIIGNQFTLHHALAGAVETCTAFPIWNSPRPVLSKVGMSLRAIRYPESRALHADS
jgi:hypothetical protein